MHHKHILIVKTFKIDTLTATVRTPKYQAVLKNCKANFMTLRKAQSSMFYSYLTKYIQCS